MYAIHNELGRIFYTDSRPGARRCSGVDVVPLVRSGSDETPRGLFPGTVTRRCHVAQEGALEDTGTTRAVETHAKVG